MTRLTKAIRRVTRMVLPRNFGTDRDKPLVVELWPSGAGDFIRLWPHRCRKRTESIAVIDLYHYLIRCRANLALLERAREAKARKAARLAAARTKRAERRLFRRKDRNA